MDPSCECCHLTFPPQLISCIPQQSISVRIEHCKLHALRLITLPEVMRHTCILEVVECPDFIPGVIMIQYCQCEAVFRGIIVSQDLQVKLIHAYGRAR